MANGQITKASNKCVFDRLTPRPPPRFLRRSDSLGKVGITGETGLALIPSGLAEVDDATMERNLNAIEALLELEDVDSVEHNMA